MTWELTDKLVAAMTDTLPGQVAESLVVKRGGDLAGMTTRAAFSPCGAYRYDLEWRWSEGPALMAWMLNPSTADHEKLDPTISGLVTRARAWNLNAVRVVNLFAFRATDPADMKRAADPIGRWNDWVTLQWLCAQAIDRQPVLCAWGAHGRHLGRDRRAFELAGQAQVKLTALMLNADGTPRHPLYVPHATRPADFPAP